MQPVQERTRESRTVRLYRLMLAVTLPAAFREQFADEMVSVFAALHAHRSRVRGFFTLGILARELPGLCRLSWHEHRSEHALRPHQPTNISHGDSMFEIFQRDVGLAARRLWRAPMYSGIVILTLALGIGANTAIFSLVHGVLFRPLALDKPEQLLAVGEAVKRGGPYDYSVTTAGSFFDWQRKVQALQLAASSPVAATLTGRGEPERLTGMMAVGGLFDLLGMPALYGRTLHVSDEDPGSAKVVILSYPTWKLLFGGDREIIGRSIVLDGVARTVVGVMPAHFRYPDASAQYWTAAQYTPEERANRDQYQLFVVGRIKPSVTMSRVRAEFDAAAADLRRDWPGFNSQLSLVAFPLQESMVGDVRQRLWIIMGAVAFVLLIACANIGNLMLSRAIGRRREIAIRQALGARRSRIARQLFTESLMLSLIGGLAGVMTGQLFLKLMLAAQATTNLPRVDEISLDANALLFTFSLALLAGLFFGGFPAWQLTQAKSTDALKSGTRGTARHQWVRNSLVVSELALAMVLLTGAGLLLRSFALLQRVNPGVQASGILTFRVSVRGRPEFAPQTLEEIRNIPGVRSAAVVSTLPISGRGSAAWFNRIDKPLTPGNTPNGEAYRVVSPEYFATIGIPLVAGRFLNASDTRANPGVVINQALAKRYYSGEDPIGKPVYMGAPDNRVFEQALIVGVVGDTRDGGLGSDPLPTVFAPLAVIPSWPGLSYVIRTTVPPMSVAKAATAVIHRLDANLPVRSVRTMDTVLGASVDSARWSTTLLSTFASLAFIMAALGVFGVLSYNVAQRTREIGIRTALGATPSAVRTLIVRQGIGLVVAGLAIGGVAAFVLARFMESMLYGVTSTDPVTFGASSLLLVLVAILAAYVPARRATLLDPVQALRAE